MNSQQIELVLRKQRLLQKSAVLRAEFAGHVVGVTPLLTAADRVCAGARWLGARPYLVVLATTVLVIAKPRAVWRWAKRGFVLWRVWNRARGFLQGRLSFLSR